MAEFYIREMRSVQPEGPYHLGGISAGGLIALEMAQRLHAQGQKVGLLALLDTECPVCSPHFPKRSYLFAHKLIPWMLSAEYKILQIRRQGLRQFLRPKAARARKSPNDLETDGVRSAPSNLPSDTLERIYRLNRAATLAYSPRPYPGLITFFHAAERHPYLYATTDTRLAWSDFAGGGFDLQLVPGHHGTMRYEPYVRVLAAKLTACLNRAHKATASEEKLA